MLVALAVGAYLVAGIAALIALWKRKFRVTRHADQLWETYWHFDPADIKRALLDDASESYGHNRGLLKTKACALLWVLSATGVELVLVTPLFSLRRRRLAPFDIVGVRWRRYGWGLLRWRRLGRLGLSRLLVLWHRAALQV